MSSSEAESQRKPYNLLSSRQKRRRVQSKLKGCLGVKVQGKGTSMDTHVDGNKTESIHNSNIVCMLKVETKSDIEDGEGKEYIVQEVLAESVTYKGCENKMYKVGGGDIATAGWDFDDEKFTVAASSSEAMVPQPTAMKYTMASSIIGTGVLPLNPPNSHACTCCALHGVKSQEMDALRKIVEQTAKNVSSINVKSQEMDALHRLIEQTARNVSSIKSMLEDQSQQSKQNSIEEDPYLHPAHTLQELDNLSKDNNLLEKLKHYTGYNTRDTIRKILKASMTRDFAVQFSFTGFARNRMKTKLIFSETLFCKKLFEHATSLNIHGSKKELSKEVQICLRSAADWGGARGGKRATDTLTTNVEFAAATDGCGAFAVEGNQELLGAFAVDSEVRPHTDVAAGPFSLPRTQANHEGAPLQNEIYIGVNENVIEPELEPLRIGSHIKTDESLEIVRALGFNLRKL